MKQKIILGSLLTMISIANLYAQYLSLEWLNFISKPLIMPLLAVWLFASGIRQHKKIARNILMALFGSWLGDIFMMFQRQDSIYFILGLSAFLMAHVFYIFTYKTAMYSGTHKKKKLIGVIAGIFIAGYLYLLLTIIMDSLGDLKYPVIFYGIIISIMLWTAIVRKGKTNQRSYILVFLGSVLFVISDSLIALNKFNSPINQAGLWIMSTYIAAQFLIAGGVLSHVRTRSVISTIL